MLLTNILYLRRQKDWRALSWRFRSPYIPGVNMQTARYLKIGTALLMKPLSNSGEGGGHWFLFLEMCTSLHLDTLKVIIVCVFQLLSESMSA